MLKRYTFWLTAAVLFQLVTGLIHAISLFVPQQAENETERQMLTLMTTYKIDLGGGFMPTFANVFTALSSCFTFLCIFAAFMNGYLLVKHTEPDVMRGIIAINLATFGFVFLVMAFFTFLLPITCVGLIFINLLAAFIVVPRSEPRG